MTHEKVRNKNKWKRTKKNLNNFISNFPFQHVIKKSNKENITNLNSKGSNILFGRYTKFINELNICNCITLRSA